MTLKEIDVKTFENYAKKSTYRTFMQTKEIGKLRELNGWTSYYLGLYDNKKLVGATLLVGKKRHFNKYEFYAPRGPLVDYNDEKTLKEFLTKLTDFVKKHQGYVLRIDPYVINKERNGKGEVVEGGVDNSKIVDEIKSSGFKLLPLNDREQVSWMYVLDIKDKTEEEVLKNMKPNTRNTIRKTQKNGIEIIELEKKDLKEFYKIMEETGKRKGFAIRNLQYFENMYDLFKPNDEIKYLITKLDLDKHLELLNKDKKEKEEELSKLSDAKYNDGKRKSINEAINGINKRIKEAESIKKEHGNVITLSGSMFIMTDPEIIYLSSGNYEEFMMYNSQYLIQWEMIKYAIEHNFARYNFYGIPNTFDKNDKDYGIYEFKTGFNGFVEELIGEFEIKTSPVYYLIKLIHKIRH